MAGATSAAGAEGRPRPPHPASASTSGEPTTDASHGVASSSSDAVRLNDAIAPRKKKVADHHQALLAAAAMDSEEEWDAPFDDVDDGVGVGAGVSETDTDAAGRDEEQWPMREQRGAVAEAGDESSPGERRKSPPNDESSNPPPSSIAAPELSPAGDEDERGGGDEDGIDVDACDELSDAFSDVFRGDGRMVEVTKAVLGRLSTAHNNPERLLSLGAARPAPQAADPSNAASESKDLGKSRNVMERGVEVDICDEFSDMFSDVFQGDMVEVTKNVKDRFKRIGADRKVVSDNLATEDALTDDGHSAVQQQSLEQENGTENDGKSGVHDTAGENVNLGDEVNDQNDGAIPVILLGDHPCNDTPALPSSPAALPPTPQPQHSASKDVIDSLAWGALAAVLVSPSVSASASGDMGRRGNLWEDKAGTGDMPPQIEGEVPSLDMDEPDGLGRHTVLRLVQSKDADAAADDDNKFDSFENALKGNIGRHFESVTVTTDRGDDAGHVGCSRTESESSTQLVRELPAASNTDEDTAVTEVGGRMGGANALAPVSPERRRERIQRRLGGGEQHQRKSSAPDNESVPLAPAVLKTEEEIDDAVGEANIATDDDHSITTNNSKEMVGTNASASSSDIRRQRRHLRIGGENALKPDASNDNDSFGTNYSSEAPISPERRRERIQRRLGGGEQHQRKPSAPDNDSVPSAPAVLKAEEEVDDVAGEANTATDDDHSITTNNSKETLGTDAVASSSDKRRQRRHLRSGSENALKPDASNDNDPFGANCSNETPGTGVLTAISTDNNRESRHQQLRSSGQPQQKPSAPDDDVSLATGNSKEMFGTNASTDNSDKRRERRKLRQGGSQQEESNGSSDILPLPVVVAEEEVDVAAAAGGESIKNTNTVDEDFLRTNGSKETLGAKTLVVSSDRCRERRKLRRGEENQEAIGELSEMALLPAISVKEAFESTAPNVPNDENSITSSNSKETLGTNSSTVNSDKRRERRRKLILGEPKESDHASEMMSLLVVSAEEAASGGDAIESTTNDAVESSAADSNNIIHSDKRRERRKLRRSLSEQSQQQQIVDEPKESPPDMKKVTRMRKIAERVAMGKVPVPKALLDQVGMANNNTALQPTLSSSMEAWDSREEGRSSPAKTPTTKQRKATWSLPSSASPPAGGTNSPKTPTHNIFNSATSPSSHERLIVTPTNEVEMKLIEGEGDANVEMEKIPALPNLQTTPSLEKHDARRSRRYLRKGPLTNYDRVEMALNNNKMFMDKAAEDDEVGLQLEESQVRDEGVGVPPPEMESRSKSYGYLSDNIKSTLVGVLEKDMPQRQRKASDATAARSKSPASSCASSGISGVYVDPEVSRQIEVALEKARKQRLEEKDKEREGADHIVSMEEGLEVDDEEAKELFPHEDTVVILSSKDHCHVAVLQDSDSAWNTNDASNLNKMLETSKARNKDSIAGSKPLLHLETISSDHDGKSKSLEAASTKLLAQSERMAMYISGAGFGEGEDSSLDVDVDESETSQGYNSEEGYDGDNAGVEVNNSQAIFDYEDMNNIIDVDDQGDDGEQYQAFDTVHCSRSANDVPSFSPDESAVGKSRAHRWVNNPDAMSEVDDESEFFDMNTTTDGTSVFGLHFVGSSTVCSNSTSLHPTPPQSPFEIGMPDPDSTPKIGSTKHVMVGSSSQVKLFKIAPPPPDKLRQWEEGKAGGMGWPLSKSKTTSEGKSSSSEAVNGDANDERHASPIQTSSSKSQHRRDDSLNYKIHQPKSPLKQNKKKGSLTDELDLASHKRMAEKIALASSKAARKFEEEYSPSHHHHDNSEFEDAALGVTQNMKKNAASIGTDRFFCTGDGPLIPEPLVGNPEQHNVVVGELLRGAFSPWKIPDRAEDETSSIASSARMLHESESYVSATAAAMKSIRGQHYGHKDDSLNESSLNESYEVSLEESHEEYEDGRGGLLTDVLRWLFEEVLPSDSPIAAAFSAFDIDISTTVQSDRVLAIANNNESFNIICNHVATMVMKIYGSKSGGDSAQQPRDVPHQMLGDESLDDVSVSTYESSLITTSSVSENKFTPGQRVASHISKGKKRSMDPFKIPPSTVGNGNACPSADVLAANFVGFLQQISTLAELPSPFGKENPFLQSVVRNLTTKPDFVPKREARKTMQDILFPNEDCVVRIFLFLRKACKGPTGREDVKQVLSAIEEGTNDGNRNSAGASPIQSHNTPEVVSSSQADSPRENHQARGKSSTVHRSNRRKVGHQTKEPKRRNMNFNLIFPEESPSPFETAVWNTPSIVQSILSFIGNPVAVCVMKRLNVFCNRVVCENQHVLIRDAVRLGGMSKYVRPSFWLWVTEMCNVEDPIPLIPSRRGYEPRNDSSTSLAPKYSGRDFLKLRSIGSKGKWQHVIERDVTRAFGNMPPHKTGARYRQDSIVRALVSFGKEEIMRNSRSYQAMDKLPEESEAKHFKLSSRLDRRDDSSNCSSGSLTPTDTVSDWGGISPVGSMVSEDPSVSGNAGDGDKSALIVSYENGELLDVKPQKLMSSYHTSRSDVSDPVLSGNTLTSEMKVDLQSKLRMILHALAARHEGVGYCQGMDYVVAHLLRVLQDTILLRVVQRSMPSHTHIAPNNNEMTLEVEDWRTISSDELRARMSAINSQSVVVEEVVFGVMDTFFSTYGLQHMYWPELRCLKTCCRVFESLIDQKLPVLADHFQHHDLNVGLFALGWFQTLFLYLPGMPSTTVCHMWDIWLVERSFKIFFRVGTAILFLSQPTLLNHDLEGMMTYLNTFPDATLLRRDILIPCALQIKITNRMLVEIEMDLEN